MDMPYLQSSKTVALIVLENRAAHTYDLCGQDRWTVGRLTDEHTPDIPLQSPIAGRRHGELLYLDGQWFFCDQGSINGTLLNGYRIPPSSRGTPIQLRNGDVLQIDYPNLQTPDPRGVWMLFAASGVQGSWQYAPLTGCPKITIGRDPQQCSIVQPLPYISACHAEITCVNGTYHVADCDSTAGTWLNGQRIGRDPVLLQAKDRISICGCHFLFTGEGLIYNDCTVPPAPSKTGEVLLTADIHSKKVPNFSSQGQKELLRDIRLSLHTGQLVALLGGSGAGKSTLINCLNGMEQNGVSGLVLFRGEDLYRNFDRLKCLIGSVPQDNVLHQMLSVEEELVTAARLRLPRDTKKKDIQRHVDAALASLNLLHKRNTQIQKLSGGERKRVNIGVELVADRLLLCLDEPDAGLDPSAKDELFRLLRRLAHEEGRCILVIIHDVSKIDLFDQIIMLAKVNGTGRLAYAGSPDMARKHFQVENLSDAYSLIEKHPQKYIMEH